MSEHAVTGHDIDWDSLRSVISAFNQNVRAEVDYRWNAWQIDLSQNEVHEVVGGLLSRQATLAIELVSTPSAWTGHIAPMILRTMGDAHINLAWILKSPLERSRRFIRYGLGQIKLQIEHHKARWEAEPPEVREKQMVEAMEHWLNGQRFSFLTEVNVGNWSEVSVREMAQEADIVDFYNFSYSPFSAAVHSMWHHIAQYNLSHCRSPLHRFHRLPGIAEPGSDPYNAILAAKYFNKSVMAFDAAFGLHLDIVSSYQEFRSTLPQVFEALNDQENSNTEV